MDTHHRASREKLVFRLAFASIVLALVIVFVLTIVQAYVRWSTNQNFTFLGGDQLEALTVSAFAGIIALSYLYRPEKVAARESEAV